MKRILTITAVSLLALSPMYGQDSCRYPQDPTLEKSQAYAGYDCVTLLDSTAVTVQPTGSGAFSVCKAFKVQTPKGSRRQPYHQIRLRPADGACRVSLRHDLPCEWRRDQSRRDWGLRLCRPRTCHLLGRPADHAGSGPPATGRCRGVRDRQERFHLRLADGGRRRAFHPSYAGDSFTISSPSGLPSLPCVRYTGYPCRWRKSCNSSSTKANVPLPCDMRMDGKYIPSPPTISFLSPRNRIW